MVTVQDLKDWSDENEEDVVFDGPYMYNMTQYDELTQNVSNEFNSINEDIDMNQYLSDIFLELEDEGYQVNIENGFTSTYCNNKNFNHSSKSIPYYTVIIHNKIFKLKDIFELLLTSDSYMRENDWYIHSMRFRSPGVQNTKDSSYSNPCWFSLNYNDIIKLKEGDINKEVNDIDYIEIEFKIQFR